MADDPVDPERHVAAAKQRLVHLAAMGEKTAAAEDKILAAATHRLANIRQALATLGPRVHLDPAAADRYQDLTLESGQLETIIATAQAHAASSNSASKDQIKP